MRWFAITLGCLIAALSVSSVVSASSCNVHIRGLPSSGPSCPQTRSEILVFSDEEGRETVRTIEAAASPGWAAARQIDVGTRGTEINPLDQVSVGSYLQGCFITGPVNTNVSATVNLDIFVDMEVSRLGPSPGGQVVWVEAASSAGFNSLGRRSVQTTNDPNSPFLTSGQSFFDTASFPPSGGVFLLPRQRFQSNPEDFPVNYQQFSLLISVATRGRLLDDDVTNSARIREVSIGFPTDGSPVMNLPADHDLDCVDGPIVDNIFMGSIIPLPPIPTPPGCRFPTVAYYRFDNDGPSDTDPATTARDECLHRHGTTMNSPVYAADVDENPVPRTGEPNALSLDFDRGPGDGNDGTEQYIVVPDHEDLSFGSSPFTIEAWVKLETLGAPCPVCESGTCTIIGGICTVDTDCSSDPVCDTAVEKGNSAYILQKKAGVTEDSIHDSQMDYGFMAQLGDRGNGRNTPPANLVCKPQSQFTGRELAFEFGDGTSSFTTAVSNLEINDLDWHFVSLAFDGVDEVRFGLDGVFDTCVGLPLTHFENMGELIIGAKTTSASPTGLINRRFDGTIDELRISEAFLAETEFLPEPGVLLQLISGGLGLVWLYRRRSRGLQLR